jgi:hypothetical protein
MSRVADSLQKAKERGDLDAGLVPDQSHPIRVMGSVSLPWNLETEWPLDGMPAPADTQRPAVEPLPALDVERRALMAAGEWRSGPHILGAGAEDGTLAQVLSPSFQRTWEEAVAIVEAVASRVRGGVAVPAPEHILLEEGGSVTFMSRNDSAEDPVVSLAVLLGRLLEGTDAPFALRQLAVDNARAEPTAGSVRAFSRALATFEPVKPKTDLAAVAARLTGLASECRPGVIELFRRRVAGFRV